ncbi:MAG: hypothetical protein QOG13_1177 [Sphingomonadales bacterium]|jgi:hypothetical protein|nr:hypothetical protein [Sphingomonadales bacterium]MEA3045604.1 hypothetical protein [Sphingomonadales bacterium]
MTGRFDPYRKPWCAGWARAAIVLAALPAHQAAASLPLPPPTYYHYGPVRICYPLYAVDARAGEGVIHDGSRVTIRTPGHRFSFGADDGMDAQIARGEARPLGELDLTGIGRFQRVELFPSNGAGRRIVYLSEIGRPPARIGIFADSFDGSAADEALLRRVALGERVREMCAAVPEGLDPQGRAQDWHANWFAPARWPGPMTLCMSHLAFEVRAGEAAILPWDADANRYGIETPAFSVGVAGGFASSIDPGGLIDFDGPIAADPRFELRAGNSAALSGDLVTFAPDAETRWMRLLRKSDIAAFGHPEPGPGLTFGFSAAASEADIAAFAGRFRARRPNDHCLEPESR